MTDDELEQALRDSLEARATVRDDDIRPLRGYIKALPPRRNRRGGAVLAVAAGVVVMLGIGGLLVANLPVGSGGAAPGAPDPAAFAFDPRLAVCDVTAADAEAIFELEHIRDYPLHLPAAYKLVGLQGDPDAPALVIVLAGPASGDRAGNTPGPGNHDLCMVVGADKASWARVDIVDVDTTGLIGVLPEPTGTPFADALAPWAERCGGVDARILDVYTFDHGTDVAASLALDPAPPELETDKPGAVIVYADGHPFPPMGTPPADGATIGPREPLAPGRHDLCVLIGADPAAAERTIHEDVAVDPARQSGASTEPETSPSPAPAVLPPQLDPTGCRQMKFTDERCLAVVDQALRNASLAWTDIDRVAIGPWADDHLMRSGRGPFATVTFTLTDGTTTAGDVSCPSMNVYSLVCTDNPEIPLSAPYGDGTFSHDLPCNLPGGGCPSPMPTINPRAAKAAVPLRVDARDIPITSIGPMEVDMGRATLPNGFLTDTAFTLADPHTRTFQVAEGINLEVRSLDPSRPPLDNIYEHGWYPGTEDVEVYLVMDVTSFTPGAMLEVRDLVVR